MDIHSLVNMAITTLWGEASFVDTRYAHAPDVVKIEFRLAQKILADRSAQLQDELLDLDQELNAVQQEYRRQGSAPNRYYDKRSSK